MNFLQGVRYNTTNISKNSSKNNILRVSDDRYIKHSGSAPPLEEKSTGTEKLETTYVGVP